MNDLSTIHRTEAYLSVHLTHAGPAGAPQPVGPFITISRQSGTGGSTLARALAARLADQGVGRSWTVYCSNLIEEMLQSNHLPHYLARFLPEDRIRELDASIGELVGLHPNLWDLVAKTNELIRHLARAGNAILLGRGSNFATMGLIHGVHVRLVAPEDMRAARTARWLSLSHDAALAQNRTRDAARRRYVRATFQADIEDPTAYDLVLNADRAPLEMMVDVVSRLVAARSSPPPPAVARAAAFPGASATFLTRDR